MRNTGSNRKKSASGDQSPCVRAGECALLKAVTVTRSGAFMDTGMERDLLVPVSQQLTPMVKGCSYVVYVFLDPQNNVIGSTKLHKFLDEHANGLAPTQRRQTPDLVAEIVDAIVVAVADQQ